MGCHHFSRCRLFSPAVTITLSRILFSVLTLSTLLTGCSSPSRPAPLVVLNSQPELPDTPKQTRYTVQSGDTLFAIAWYTGNDYQDIAKWNNLAPPYVIYPGQSLDLQPQLNDLKPLSNVKKPSGTTSSKNTKMSIDPKESQAYCECEPNVNKPVTSDKTSKSKRLVNAFPERVSQWQWPATGRFEQSQNGAEPGVNGVDIYAARGSNVVAAAAGKVVYAGNALRGYGNLIIIKHTDSFLSAYAHNESIVVSERDWIQAGDVIGKVGSSGTTTNKLHFEIRYRGKSLDPLKYLPKQPK